MICFIRQLFFGFIVAQASMALAEDPQQPMKPVSGFGSDESDLCNGECAERFTLEPIESPDRVSYYVPKVMKNGTTAPLVVYLHGFFAPVPEIYQDHINHLTRMGYIVVFPQYQAGNWGMVKELGIFATADQGEWLRRAVAATKRVISVLGDKVEPGEIYGFGHSIGGLLLLGWDKAGGPAMNAMVLANPKLNLKSGIPTLVRKLIRVKELPWMDMVDDLRSRVIVLGGNDDKIAPSEEYLAIKERAINAKSFAFYIAHSDRHTPNPVKADHMAPMTNGGILKYLHWMLDMVDGTISLDTYDFRFYYAAFDAMLAGQTDFTPDLGYWSDGVPFGKVAKVF